MFFISGILIGLLGSLHCIGMCGPIAIAITGKTDNMGKLIIQDLLYNLGRVFTYTLLGLIVGIFGLGIKLTGYQGIFSIILGILIILYLLLPGNFKQSLNSISSENLFTVFIRKKFTLFINSDSSGSKIIIGILNGFLPCGLVFIALTSAVSTGDTLNSMMLMAGFGLGTVPSMFSVYFSSKIITNRIRLKLSKLLPLGMTIIAMLLIMRGISYEIPRFDFLNLNNKTINNCH